MSLAVVKEQLDMAREHALLGSYNTAMAYYDAVLKQLRGFLQGGGALCCRGSVLLWRRC